jgi:hypothetical protein
VLRWQGSQMRNPTTLLRLMHRSGWRRMAGKRLPGLLATAR